MSSSGATELAYISSATAGHRSINLSPFGPVRQALRKPLRMIWLPDILATRQALFVRMTVCITPFCLLCLL